MPKPSHRTRVAHRSGHIALVGAASTGKTAYLVALDLSPRAREQLVQWDLRESPTLHEYVAALGQSIGNTNRRSLLKTDKSQEVAELTLFTASRRSAMPHVFRHKYQVAIPDIAGEVYNWAAGLDQVLVEADKKKRDGLLQTLRGYRAIIGLVDVTPRLEPMANGDLRSRQKSEIVNQIKGLDHVLRQLLAGRSGDLVATLALTKCDTIPHNERLVRLRAADSARHQYLLAHGIDPLTAKVRQLAGGEISYSLDDIDGADSEGADRPAWQGDVLHHDAVARDWLRCHVPTAGRQVDSMSQYRKLSLDVCLVSSWGHQLEKIEDDKGTLWEPVPIGDEIQPVRLFAPLCSVLDRLHERRVRAALGKRLSIAAAVLALILAVGPGLVWWRLHNASSRLTQGDLPGARRYADRVVGHVAFDILPQSMRAAVARVYVDLAKAHEAQEASATGPELARSARADALACSRRAIAIDTKPEFVAWRASYVRTCLARTVNSDPPAALALLRESAGAVTTDDGVQFARQVATTITDVLHSRACRVFADGQSMDSAERATHDQSVDAVEAFLDELARPGFCVGTPPLAEALAAMRARLIALRACVAALALPKDGGATAAKSCREIVDRCAAALTTVGIARPADAESTKLVQESVDRAIARCMQQPNFQLDVNAAATDPEAQIGRVDALTGLLGGSSADQGERLRNALTQLGSGLSGAVWRGLSRATPGATPVDTTASGALAQGAMPVLLVTAFHFCAASLLWLDALRRERSAVRI